MLKVSKKFSRGDSIIEVLFAVTIFSALAISGLSVMNRGVGTAQRSLEVSLVRQEMNSQAEVLRFMHDSYVSGANTPPAEKWKEIIDEWIATPFAGAARFVRRNAELDAF